VFVDALRVKIRDETVVRSKAVYLALAVLPDGTRDILGIWIEQTEGAKFWLNVFTDLKTRGCQDILDCRHRYVRALLCRTSRALLRRTSRARTD
jgi:transposase-like protein